ADRPPRGSAARSRQQLEAGQVPARAPRLGRRNALPAGGRRQMTDPLFDLAGRVAAVTGGMGQLGAEYVAGLVERGMRVAIFDLEAATEREDDSVRAYRLDITDRAAIDAATSDLVAEWGVPHLLVNNA